MSVIASRYARLGIRSLNEQTVKYSIMLVLHMIKLKTAKWPEYETIWKWVKDFKREFSANSRMPWPHAVLRTYPIDPAGLPQDICDAAYSEDDPPVSCTLRGFDALSKHIPLRENNAFLVRERQRKQQ